MIETRLEKQMPFSMTEDEYDLLEATYKQAGIGSKAEVIRAGLTLLYGLVDDQVPDGQTHEDCIRRAVDRVRNLRSYDVVRTTEKPTAS